MRKFDVGEFVRLLALWLQQHTGTQPDAPALDGKFIRDTVGLVCPADH